MNKRTHKRARFQQGSLTTEKRSNGKVWIFRWREPSHDGTTRQRKVTLGAANKLTKTQAQKAANRYLPDLSQPINECTILTVSQLVDHYKERELGEDSGKAAKPRKAYLYIFNNYVIPQWVISHCEL